MLRQNTIVFPTVYPSIDCMKNAVPSARPGKIKKSSAEKALTRFTERNAHWIVHTSGNDDFQSTAIGFGTKDVSSSSCVPVPIPQAQGLLLKAALAPVEPTIRCQIRTMQIVPASIDGFTVEPGYPFVCNVILILIGKFPDVRWCSHINFSLVNEDSFWKRDLFSKDG